MKFGFQKKLPKALSDFGDRDLVWLWNYMVNLGYPLNEALLRNNEAIATEVSRLLVNADDFFFEQVRVARQYSMLTKDEVSLISVASSRLISWLYFSFGHHFDFEFKPEWPMGGLNDRQVLLAAVDYDPRSLSEKREIMGRLRNQWSSILEFDVHYAWIKNDDEDLSFWLLERGRKANFPTSLYGKVNDPIDSKERVVKFKCMMDQVMLPLDLKKLFIDKLKSDWKSRGRQKSKDRVQSNVLVLPETKSGIKVLRDQYGLKSGGEVVDKLVSDALRKF